MLQRTDRDHSYFTCKATFAVCPKSIDARRLGPDWLSRTRKMIFRKLSPVCVTVFDAPFVAHTVYGALSNAFRNAYYRHAMSVQGNHPHVRGHWR